MNRVWSLGLALAIVGIVVIAATGVDLVHGRSGIGFLILGAGSLLLALLKFFKLEAEDKVRLWLLPMTYLGGFYFILRALIGGPIGLAIPDVVLVFSFLAAYFAVSSSGRGHRIFLMLGLVLLCSANLGVAMFQEFGTEVFYVWEDAKEEWGYTTGLFDHYNRFAGFLNGTVFFFLSYLLLGKKLSLRVGSGFLVVGMIAALIFSGSRGGWVSFVAAGVIWFAAALIYLKQKKSRMFSFALITGVLLMVVGVTSSYWALQKLTERRAERLTELQGYEVDSSVTDGGRFAFQQLAFEIFTEAPLAGAGPRAFSYLSLEKWDNDEWKVTSAPPDFAHNEYLQSLSDYGIIGLVIIMGLLFVHGVSGVFSAVTGSQSKDELAIWKIGAIGGLVAILCQCFFSFLIHFPSCMILVAVQMGLLASKSSGNPVVEVGVGSKISGYLVGTMEVVVSVCICAVGFILTQSYLLNRKAEQQIAASYDNESVLRGLNTMAKAGDTGRDPKIFEKAGRIAMQNANRALEGKDPEWAEKFNLEAKSAFESALKYNPHFAAGIAGLPRVEEALGNWNEAAVGHERAIEKIWSREYKLKPYFYAAHSSFGAALRSLYADDKDEALRLFRQGQQRINKRREILHEIRELSDEKAIRLELEGWINFMEARLLFQEGDHVWKNVRPRNPELAHGLMLEAQKRYQASEAVVREKYPNWEKQVQQLQFNLGHLTEGLVRPAKISEEQIKAIIGSQEGLDSRVISR